MCPAGCLHRGGWRLGRTDAPLICLRSLATSRPSSCSLPELWTSGPASDAEAPDFPDCLISSLPCLMTNSDRRAHVSLTVVLLLCLYPSGHCLPGIAWVREGQTRYHWGNRIPCWFPEHGSGLPLGLLAIPALSPLPQKTAVRL